MSYKYTFEPVINVNDPKSWAVLMELLAGYGLGGSSIALFGRVGGGNSNITKFRYLYKGR